MLVEVTRRAWRVARIFLLQDVSSLKDEVNKNVEIYLTFRASHLALRATA